MSDTSPELGNRGSVTERAAGSRLDSHTVGGVNRLTAAWAQRAAPEQATASTVFSGVGVWPLLAMLATGAAGDVRADLATAIGVVPERAGEYAHTLVETLRSSDQLRAAVGLWVADRVPLDPDWVAACAPESIGRLTGRAPADQAVLDAWADRHTDGLIKRLPVSVNDDTLMVLASALSIRLRWERGFTEAPHRIGHGPWSATDPVVGLSRTTSALDDLAVTETSAGALSLMTVRGVGDVDVVLALGESDRPATQVLAAAVTSVTDAAAHRSGSQLEPGFTAPGVTVTDVPSVTPARTLALRTVGFDIVGDHDLIEQSDLFGVGGATVDHQGLFPGISAVDLKVSSAAQTAMATFSADGFVAAAVTAFAMMAGRAAPPAQPKNALTRLVEVAFDRPFGFLARHRPTGLVLVAGWVGQPQPWPSRLD